MNNNLKASHYFNRGVANYHLERYVESVEDYNSAIQLNANAAKYFHNRACSKEALNDFLEAKKDFEIAHKLTPQIYNFEGEQFHPNNFTPFERPPLFFGYELI